MKHTTIGFVGLGRMGLNMAARLIDTGVTVVGVDESLTAQAAAQDGGVHVVSDLSVLIARLPAPKVVWLMVPSRYVDDVLEGLTAQLSAGDIVIDGGNSFYEDTLRRYKELGKHGIRFLDVGTSGGVAGAREGAALMVGGEKETVAEVESLFLALAAKDGYAHVGGPGAGHFVKMVHNGIEYGMMGALAEGMTVLHTHTSQFDLSLEAVLRPYEHESIIAGKLVSWLRQAYDEKQLDQIAGEVPRGETESEMEHLSSLGDMPVLEAALAQRQQSREDPSYTGKVIAALRNQFGGHKVIYSETNEDSNGQE